MSESQIDLALTLAFIWSLGVVPLLFLHTVTKFMDIMRRRKDSEPW